MAFTKGTTLAVRLWIPSPSPVKHTHSTGLTWVTAAKLPPSSPLRLLSICPAAGCNDFAATVCFYISPSSGDVCLHTKQTNTITVYGGIQMWTEETNRQGYSGQPLLWKLKSHSFSPELMLGDWLLELFQHLEVHESLHVWSSVHTISNCIIKR